MADYQSEAQLESDLVTRLTGLGYAPVTLPDMTAMHANLRAQLGEHNGVTLSDGEFAKVLNHLDKGNVFEKAKTLRGRMQLTRDDGTPLYLQFLNTQDWCQNQYQVTTQVTVTGHHKTRFDVTLLINGLPLVQIELKRLQSETGITFVFVTHDQEEALTMSDRIAVMNEGRILQIGGPKDIYDHPAERFVADFIGDTNFIAANLQSVSGDAAQVQLPGGKTVTARAVEGGANTGSITLAVRPEHATLTAEGGILNGNLQNIVYFGTDTHYHIALDSGTTFVVRRQNQPDTGEVFSEGQTVGIHFNDGVGQVLRD